MASTLCFLKSCFSLSFFCLLSRSRLLSSCCSPSNITISAFSSAEYTTVLFFKTLLSFSRRFSKASSETRSVKIPAKRRETLVRV